MLDPASGSIYHWSWSLSGVAPWTTEPGKQLVGSHIASPPDEVGATGGPAAIYAQMEERCEEFIPGFGDAIVDRAAHTSRHGWMSPISIGPKLPRSVESTAGLWFVGDGSVPCRGMWSEAAASCGILGARAMTAAR